KTVSRIAQTSHPAGYNVDAHESTSTVPSGSSRGIPHHRQSEEREAKIYFALRDRTFDDRAQQVAAPTQIHSQTCLSGQSNFTTTDSCQADSSRGFGRAGPF